MRQILLILLFLCCIGSVAAAEHTYATFPRPPLQFTQANGVFTITELVDLDDPTASAMRVVSGHGMQVLALQDQQIISRVRHYYDTNHEIVVEYFAAHPYYQRMRKAKICETEEHCQVTYRVFLAPKARNLILVPTSSPTPAHHYDVRGKKFLVPLQSSIDAQEAEARELAARQEQVLSLLRAINFEVKDSCVVGAELNEIAREELGMENYLLRGKKGILPSGTLPSGYQRNPCDESIWLLIEPTDTDNAFHTFAILEQNNEKIACELTGKEIDPVRDCVTLEELKVERTLYNRLEKAWGTRTLHVFDIQNFLVGSFRSLLDPNHELYLSTGKNTKLFTVDGLVYSGGLLTAAEYHALCSGDTQVQLRLLTEEGVVPTSVRVQSPSSPGQEALLLFEEGQQVFSARLSCTAEVLVADVSQGESVTVSTVLGDDEATAASEGVPTVSIDGPSTCTAGESCDFTVKVTGVPGERACTMGFTSGTFGVSSYQYKLFKGTSTLAEGKSDHLRFILPCSELAAGKSFSVTFDKTQPSSKVRMYLFPSAQLTWTDVQGAQPGKNPVWSGNALLNDGRNRDYPKPPASWRHQFTLEGVTIPSPSLGGRVTDKVSSTYTKARGFVTKFLKDSGNLVLGTKETVVDWAKLTATLVQLGIPRADAESVVAETKEEHETGVVKQVLQEQEGDVEAARSEVEQLGIPGERVDELVTVPEEASLSICAPGSVLREKFGDVIFCPSAAETALHTAPGVSVGGNIITITQELFSLTNNAGPTTVAEFELKGAELPTFAILEKNGFYSIISVGYAGRLPSGYGEEDAFAFTPQGDAPTAVILKPRAAPLGQSTAGSKYVDFYFTGPTGSVAQQILKTHDEDFEGVALPFYRDTQEVSKTGEVMQELQALDGTPAYFSYSTFEEIPFGVEFGLQTQVQLVAEDMFKGMRHDFKGSPAASYVYHYRLGGLLTIDKPGWGVAVSYPAHNYPFSMRTILQKPRPLDPILVPVVEFPPDDKYRIGKGGEPLPLAISALKSEEEAYTLIDLPLLNLLPNPFSGSAERRSTHYAKVFIDEWNSWQVGWRVATSSNPEKNTALPYWDDATNQREARFRFTTGYATEPLILVLDNVMSNVQRLTFNSLGESPLNTRPEKEKFIIAVDLHDEESAKWYSGQAGDSPWVDLYNPESMHQQLGLGREVDTGRGSSPVKVERLVASYKPPVNGIVPVLHRCMYAHADLIPVDRIGEGKYTAACNVLAGNRRTFTEAAGRITEDGDATTVYELKSKKELGGLYLQKRLDSREATVLFDEVDKQLSKVLVAQEGFTDADAEPAVLFDEVDQQLAADFPMERASDYANGNVPESGTCCGVPRDVACNQNRQYLTGVDDLCTHYFAEFDRGSSSPEEWCERNAGQTVASIAQNPASGVTYRTCQYFWGVNDCSC